MIQTSPQDPEALSVIGYRLSVERLKHVTCLVFFIAGLILAMGCAGTPQQISTPTNDDDTKSLLAETAARFQFPNAPPFLTVLDQAKVSYLKDGGFTVEVHQIWAARTPCSAPPALPLSGDLQTLRQLEVRTWRITNQALFEGPEKVDVKPRPVLPNLPASLEGLALVEFPALAAGEALEVRYTLESRPKPVTAPPAAGETPVPTLDAGSENTLERSFLFRWQDTRPTLKRDLTLSRPAGMELYGVRFRLPSNLKTYELRSSDKVENTWALESRQEGLPLEPYEPHLNDRSGVSAFTPHTDWRSALEPFRLDCEKALAGASDLDLSFAEAAGDNQSSREDKARNLVHTLRARWRYADPGLPVAHQPRRPLKEAFSTGTVTPREAALLLQAGLKSIGFKPKLYLARRASGGSLLSQSPALSQFDQVLLGYEVDGKFMWVDPAEPLAPVGSLPLALLGVHALAVDNPVLWKDTPGLLARDHRKERNAKLEIGPNGAMSCSVEVSAYGSSEVALRQFLRATTDNQRRDIVARGLSKRFPTSQLGTYRFNDYRDLSQPLLVQYTFEVPDYASLDPQGRLVFYPPVFEDMEDFLSVLQDRRRSPLVLPQNFNSTVRQIYRLPRGWKPVNLPQGSSLANDVAEFITNPKVQLGTLMYERYTGLKKRVIAPGAEYKQLLAFYQVVLKQDRTPFFAEKSK